MNLKASYLLLLLVFIYSITNAQQRSSGSDRILFRGVVIAATGGSRIAGAQIYRNREMHSVSREDGTFSLFANRSDTLVFSCLGYKPNIFVVSDTLRAEEFLAGIYLQSDTLEIGEVIIIPGLSSLRAELKNPRTMVTPELNNARNNLSIASYQARTGQNTLGDPKINYEMIKQKQKISAYEKGGIPSDKIVALSPFMLLPAAYLLLHGLPEVPAAPDPVITDRELEELNRLYRESNNKVKKN